jgi:hypothetical protein
MVTFTPGPGAWVCASGALVRNDCAVQPLLRVGLTGILGKLPHMASIEGRLVSLLEITV